MLRRFGGLFPCASHEACLRGPSLPWPECGTARASNRLRRSRASNTADKRGRIAAPWSDVRDADRVARSHQRRCGREFERANNLVQRSPGSCAHGSVLILQQGLCFGRPRHQFAIQAHPIGLELLPESRLVESFADGVEHLRFDFAIIEEPSAGSGVTNTRAITDDAEACARNFFAPTNDHHSTRAHVFLFADDARHALVPVIRERLSRMLQQSGFLRRLGRGHRRRQINQPLRICGKPTHHFQRRYRILLADSDVVVQTGRDDPLAQNIVHIEANRRAAAGRKVSAFVTRKISNAAAKIALGLETGLKLGSLSAKRDWGYAPEYVEAIWRIMQQNEPDDFIIATGEAHSVQEFVEVAFDAAGLDWQKFVKVDQRFLRPLDVECLAGDFSKAKSKIGWSPKTRFKDLAKMMVKEDLNRWQRWQNGERFPWDAPNYPNENRILTRALRM